MKVSDFDYELPAELIAQRPAPRRDASRLLVLHGASLEHRRFRDLPRLLQRGDLLVLNDTRVLPARLIGRKATGGRAEILLLEPLTGSAGPARWRCLIQVARNPRAGSTIELEGGLRAVVESHDESAWILRLEPGAGGLGPWLERHGRAPLPPYVRREDAAPAAGDRRRYQTVYARVPGAVAAPTAGLHFTHGMLSRIRARGVRLARLTLHVGLGTFQPVRVERVEQHVMHAERLSLPRRTAEAVVRAREAGGRVVAVGTTVVRALESRVAPDGSLRPGAGTCDLFIHPGFRFRVVDAMITNFHLPRSTLLMLVAAFAGRERLLEAYREAIRRGYRFYSYGDAMFVGPG